MPTTIKDIAKITKSKSFIHNNQIINWLLTDSRSLTFTEGTLFFAIKTKQNNGIKYVKELMDKGIENFVINIDDYNLLSEKEKRELTSKANILLVEDSLKALQDIAKKHRDRHNIKFIGVTGSNGKTVVKEWIYQIIGSEKKVVRSPRSYNSQIGVPLSVWQVNENTDIAIIEAGISKPNEMGKLANIINPNIGILTNIGEAHRENFRCIEEKITEKIKLFEGSKVVIYCADDNKVDVCIKKSLPNKEFINWSRKDKDSPLFVKDIAKNDEKTIITYSYNDKEEKIEIPFDDEASIENAINVLAVCLYLSIDKEKIKANFKKIEPIAMRLEVKEGKNNCTIINDSYNSDLSSLSIALNFLNRRKTTKKSKDKVLILSDLLEANSNLDVLYSNVAKEVSAIHLDKLICVGTELLKYQDKFSYIKDKHFFKSTKELLTNEIITNLQNKTILIKGARRFGFEKITEKLVLKAHETILEVNLSSMIRNLNHYKAMLNNNNTKIVCMVKAYAYGVGFYEIAKTLQDHRVDYLAVALSDEGFELRKAGITSSIMVMNPELSSLKTLFDYNLEPEIYSIDLLNRLIVAAEKEGITNMPIHIKINTGMNRLGFEPKEVDLLINILKNQSAVTPRSVFSHLVGSDDRAYDEFTKEQIKIFNDAAQKLQSAFPHKIIKHICNTAGIERFPEAHFDMVRLGLGLYGIDPSSNKMINNVATLRSTILQIHNVDKGQTIGYSRKGKLKKDSKIATIPIGYADGLDRRLGNGNFYCLVNGKKAKYVGNICMDLCMIDVTNIDCKAGDDVIIFGEELPITLISDKLKTIPYEILTSISSRVKRVYYQD